MRTRLLVNPEPFEAYSENPRELEEELSRRRSAGRSGSGGGRKYWPRQSGTWQPKRPGRGGWRRPWPFWRVGYGYGYSLPDVGGTWVGWAQKCLRQLIGSWVPQTGGFGPATQRAIRIFQKRQQLPVTGLLDGATEAALRAACGGQPMTAMPTAPPPAPDYTAAPSDQDSSPEPPPANGGGDGAAADSDSGSGAAGDAASANGGDEIQQEFLVSSACRVRIQSHQAVSITDKQGLNALPRTPGVYIIHVNGKPWYVGVAERTIYERFRNRLKTLRDFKVPASALAGRSVSWVSIRAGQFPTCSIGRRPEGQPAAKYQTLGGVYAVLKILEQYFIKTLETMGKGNQIREDVVFAPSGSLTIREDGKPDIKVTGTSLRKSVDGEMSSEISAGAKDKMILSFKIPEAPYSSEAFERLHKAFDVIHGVHVTLEIFGVEVAGLMGLGLAVAGPLAAFAGTLMALGAGYYEARKIIARKRMTVGFAIGFVTGADRRKWDYVKPLFWEFSPEVNTSDEEAGRIAQKAFNLGLATGFVQGRKLSSKQMAFFWKSISSTLTPGDRQQFSGDVKTWPESRWRDWYYKAAGSFVKLYVKE